MKKILYYIAALTLSVGCTETMIDEPMIETSTTSSGKVSATFNLDIEGGESDTRVSVDTSADTWKLAWEDGDYICVYSLEQETSTTLTYVAEGNNGATFSGEVYPGENRVFYNGGYSWLSTSASPDSDPLVYLCAYGTYDENMHPTMISSEVINVEVTDDDGDGIVNDTFDMTMQQVCTAIDFKMTFTDIPDDVELSLTSVYIGGTPDDAADGEYVDIPDYIYVYPDKDVDASDFVYSTSFSSLAGSRFENVLANDTECSTQFCLLPFTFESGQKLQVTLIFNNGLIEKTFDFTNSSGADLDFPRATYTTLVKSFDLSDVADDIDAIFADTWAADAVAFADTTSAGTESDPIEIASEKELAYLARVATGFVPGQSTEGTYYKLTKDLDLEGKNWYPIGNSSGCFMGHFDGDNHTISNLTTDDEYRSYQGLFGYVENGSISNLTMEKPNISGLSNAGALAGYVYGSSVTNCGVEGGSVSNTSTFTGGLIGRLAASGMTQCYNEGTSVTGSTYVGGVAGYVNGYNSDGVTYTVYKCYNTGSVLSSGNNVGGICAYSAYIVIDSCYNSGTVSTTGDIFGYLGGIVGRSGSGTTIKRCYNSGSIGSESVTYSAGITMATGSSSAPTVVACYNVGTIIGRSDSEYVAGIATQAANVTSCYDASGSTTAPLFNSSYNYIIASNCYCLAPTVAGEHGTQLTTLADLNAKVDDMNTAANTALETSGVTYFTVDSTGTYLPSVMGEQIKFE